MLTDREWAMLIVLIVWIGYIAWEVVLGPASEIGAQGPAADDAHTGQ